jgi:hypothetical protein
MMRSFDALFEELGARDTFVLQVRNDDTLPDDDYRFCECYCADPRCDCRRVLFCVHGQLSQQQWAVINWGWASARFYAEWARCGFLNAQRMRRPMLDGLHEQSPIAPVLLERLAPVLAQPAYRKLVAEHYRLFKKRLVFLTRSGRLPDGW